MFCFKSLQAEAFAKLEREREDMELGDKDDDDESLKQVRFFPRFNERN